MKKLYSVIFLLIFILVSYIPVTSKTVFNEKQSKYVKSILANEKNAPYKKDIIEIVNYIDQTYNDLYNRMQNGYKLTIFFDPAHGILKSGNWQGNVTWRQSSEGLPEEYYSLFISRLLYQKLKANKYINVVSTDDYVESLEGLKDTYNNIDFTETIKLAKENKSFMIIASHLNNVSPLWKADGVVNIPGIQVTCDKYGRQYLTKVKGQYKGYLTLYNKLDTSGFSYDVAINFKKQMLKYGHTPNNWDRGAVAYDRFSYFYQFPVSIIFESGFISNPNEEKMLRDAHKQEMIAESQYLSIVNSIENKFGIDISGKSVKQKEKLNKNTIEILKLTRLTVYYINKGEIQKAINLCSYLEKNYKTNKNYQVKAFTGIKSDLIKIRTNFRNARHYKKKKWYKTSRKYYYRAVKLSRKRPLYNGIEKVAVNEYNRLTKRKLRTSGSSSSSSYVGHPPDFKPLALKSEKHSYKTPIIFVVEEGDSINDAIVKALNPNKKTFDKLSKKFKKPVIVKYRWKKYYSKKYKKYKWRKVKTYKKVNFTPGIYIVKLDKYYNIIGADKKYKVSFNSRKYQNFQYFKNSFVAGKTKNKKL